MGFHVKSGPDPLKHPFTWKFHVNGGLRPLKHPTFHVNGFIDKEKGVLDLGLALPPPLHSPSYIPPDQRIAREARFPSSGAGFANPSALPKLYSFRQTDRTQSALSVTCAGTETERALQQLDRNCSHHRSYWEPLGPSWSDLGAILSRIGPFSARNCENPENIEKQMKNQ